MTILSGVENGVCLGTPIGLLVKNKDQRKFDCANTRSIPRPGHADYTYQLKYGVKASSGGGRASARETISRVAAGAVAEKWLFENYKTRIVSWVSQMGDVALPSDVAAEFEANPMTREEVDKFGTLERLGDGTLRAYDGSLFDGKSGESLDGDVPADISVCEAIPTRCPHPPTAAKMIALVDKVRSMRDSTGGIITTVVSNIPVGVGEPCFDKIEADLAKGMLSLPAVKGFEIGSGFRGVCMLGSDHNDKFNYAVESNGQILLSSDSNNAGGSLGGITSGANIVFRIAIKPVSSIGVEQETYDFDGKSSVLEVKGRHDPCVLPRAPPLVEGMSSIICIDHVLRQRARSGDRKLYTLS